MLHHAKLRFSTTTKSKMNEMFAIISWETFK